jgi:hypothetical protein
MLFALGGATHRSGFATDALPRSSSISPAPLGAGLVAVLSGHTAGCLERVRWPSVCYGGGTANLTSAATSKLVVRVGWRLLVRN